MKGALVRLVKGEEAGATRTDGILGYFDFEPEVGRNFSIVGEPIDPKADGRLWSTSPVVTVEKSDIGFKFTTRTGSIYRLYIKPSVEP